MTTFFDKLRKVDEAIKSHEAEADKSFETITAERSNNLEGSLAALTLEERESHQQLNALLDDLSRPIKRMEAELADVHDWPKARIRSCSGSLLYHTSGIMCKQVLTCSPAPETGFCVTRDSKHGAVRVPRPYYGFEVLPDLARQSWCKCSSDHFERDL